MREFRAIQPIACLAWLIVFNVGHAEPLKLSGSGWYIHEATSASDTAPALAVIDNKSWIPAHVPGNIQADLEAAHLIGPLWYGAGDARMPEVAKRNWWYRTDFVAPRSPTGERQQLIFTGVDFGYEVWLNGKSLGRRSGQFRRSEFDVSSLLRPGQVNQLAVRIDPIPPQLEHCWSSDLPMSGAGTPDWFINCYLYARQTLRDLKSVTNLAYDWGVNVYTLGIWRDVWLESSGSSRIDSLRVQTKLTDNFTRASIHVNLAVDSRVPIDVRATVRISRVGFSKTVVAIAHLGAGANNVEATAVLGQPALWWPAGQGAQPLYDVDATLTDGSGKLLDRKRTRIGIRDIHWAQVEGAPADFPNPYQLIVNGRKVRMLGSSLVPPDLLFGRIGLRAPLLLQRAKTAGMNTFRLWGGGVPMPPEFYDLADELGIMLSQEFPMANSVPESDAVFLENMSQSVTDIMKELRNHASIIEWNGGNEMSWTQSTDHIALHTLKALAAVNDDRIFRATDPIDGSQHSPWYFIPQASYQHFNRIWEVSTDPAQSYMRYGEFGSQTPANLEAFQREIPPASQWPLEDINDPVLIRKNVLQAAFNPLDWLYKPVIEGYFGPVEGPEELIKAGQYIGADSLRYFVDEMRRKGRKTAGLTTWDFNEPFPNGAGSFLVDYDGQPLMNYSFMQEALAPVSLSLRYDSNLYLPSQGVQAALWLVNDSPATVDGIQWSWTARDRRGRVLGKGAGTASINPGEARELRKLDIKMLPDTALGPVVVELESRDARGQRLTERTQIFGAESAVDWPFDGLIRNQVADPDDTTLVQPRTTRVLWIRDSAGDDYDDTSWNLKRFGIRVTYASPGSDALERLASSVQALRTDFDVIWIGAADYRNLTSLGQRLGAANLATIAAAVNSGIGIGFEGGWKSFAAAGFEGSPLESVLPVVPIAGDRVARHPSTGIVIADPQHPIVGGRLATTFPRLGGYLTLQPLGDAHTILRSTNGDPLLVTRMYGKGRVLGFASGVSTNWTRYGGADVDWAWDLRAWSGQPAFVSRMLSWLAGATDASVAGIDLPGYGMSRTTLPIRRTTVVLDGHPKFTAEGSGELMRFVLRNTGDMTALYCKPNPVLEYRTDTEVDHSFISIPPGESREIKIRAPIRPDDALPLAQQGWRVSCWNSADLNIATSEDVLLSLGRHDRMNREFAAPGATHTAFTLYGRRPDSSIVPWLLGGRVSSAPDALTFEFQVPTPQVLRASRLDIHTADQAATDGSIVDIEVNGRGYSHSLQRGLGVQLSDPAHLAFPETVRFDLPAGTWRTGTNTLTIRVHGDGWFTWDSMNLTVR